MMRRPTIAIDIDDTIADSTESLRLLVNKRVGVELSKEAYKVQGEYWGYYERVWEAHGLTGKVSHDDFAKEMVDDQSHVPLLPGALLAIQELSKRYTVILLTARDSSWELATRRWLRDRFGDFDVDLYFCESHKDAKAKTKGELCKDIEARLLIDDNVGHCQSALDSGVEAILFGEYGWHTNTPNGVRKCKDWQAVLEYLAAKQL